MDSSGKIDNSIALCLSGGGLRATLFHLGVIKALRAYSIDGEMALRRVSEVFAVSGGSILAAHMLKNWDVYIGNDETAFNSACGAIAAFARRDLRNRLLRRWGLTGLLGMTRGYWLQREYAIKGLLGDADLAACYAYGPRPAFHFLATNFNTGELCSFSGKHFEKTRRVGDQRITDRTPADNVKLAFAVTASSSFPPMFPPVPLTPDMLSSPEGTEFSMPIALSDGGVYDNFGIEKFKLAERDGDKPDVLIVSSAGGSFQTAPDRSYSGMITRNIRASDIMMRRVGEDTLNQGREAGSKGFMLIRIGETVDDRTVQVTTQQLLRLVRTDLDRFGPELAGLLVDHGRRVAGKACADRGWSLSEMGPPTPRDNREDALLHEVAKRASTRNNWALFFDFRDVVWLVLWWVIAAAIASGVISGGRRYLHYREEQRQQEVGQAVQSKIDNVILAYQSGDNRKLELALGIAAATAERAAGEFVEGNRNKPVITPSAPPQVVAPPNPQPPVAMTHNQRVFIQFAGVLTRAQITGLNQELHSAGWQTQGSSGERTSKAAGLNEVRYSVEGNRQAAIDLADAINRSGVLTEEVGIKQLSIIGPNDLEVWISR